MHELEFIRQGLADRMPSKVAAKTGISTQTIRAIRDGKETNPKLATLRALGDYLMGVK